MKCSLRAFLLLVGLVGTFAYAIPKAPADGPMPLCPPSHPNCPDDELRIVVH